jgi:ubiquinone biosynthesis protein UbiJ
MAFVNHVLGQNPWAREALRSHAGRTVRFVAQPLVFHATITPEGLVGANPGGIGPENGSHQGVSGQMAADISLSLPLSSLPQFALDPAGAVRNVRIEGDAELAQLLGRLVREVRWDAEDDLARWVGDIAARELVLGAKAFHSYALDASQRLTETLTGFLLDEDPTLVRREALHAWAAEVARLRDDCARLEKRLENFERPLNR